jgi:hypothetical protein
MSPPRSSWRVDVDPAFEDRAPISEGAAVGLLLGIEVLRRCAGDLPAVARNGRAIRRLSSTNTYRLPDGLIVPPFSICYEMSEDGTTALIIGAREFEPRLQDVKICGSDYVEELTTELKPARPLTVESNVPPQMGTNRVFVLVGYPKARGSSPRVNPPQLRAPQYWRDRPYQATISMPSWRAASKSCAGSTCSVGGTTPRCVNRPSAMARAA